MARPTNRPAVQMPAEQLYVQLGQLLATMEVLNQPMGADGHQWLARAQVLVDAAGDTSDAVQLKTCVSGVISYSGNLRQSQLIRITQILYNALARAEMSAPTGLQGSFLPAGNAHDALVAVARVLNEAKSGLLLVDPYADANLLTSFAIQAAEKISISILATDGLVKPGLKPAGSAWSLQYGPDRPLEIRLSPPKSLHDRLIIVDSDKAWVVGQSFNALATRAPTVITRLDPETGALKVKAHLALWSGASTL